MKRQFLPMIAALGCLAGLVTSSCFSPIPSGEQLSKNDASVLSDMATPRKCAGFEAYEGTELACWDFTKPETQKAAVTWAMAHYPSSVDMAVTSDACWYAAGALIYGGSGLAKEPQPCELWLTELTKVIDVRRYSAVSVFVNYHTVGWSAATMGVVMAATSNRDLKSVLAPMASPGIGSLGLLIPSNDLDAGDSLKNYENLKVGIGLTRDDSKNRIFIQSVIVLGIPR